MTRGTVILLLLVPACSDEEAPRVKPPWIDLSPADGTTDAVGQGVSISAAVGWIRQFDPSLVERLAAEVSLRTWPELDVVPTTISIGGDLADPDQTINCGGNRCRATATLVPDQPLEERWYALRLAKVPAGFFGSVSAGDPVALDGAAQGTRFRVGSAPLLRSIRFEGPKGGRTYVDLTFSEPVLPRDDGSALVTMTQAGTTVPCDRGGMGGPQTRPSATWSGLCAGGTPGEPVTYWVRGGWASGSGAPIAGLPRSDTIAAGTSPYEGMSTWTDPVFARLGPP